MSACEPGKPVSHVQGAPSATSAHQRERVAANPSDWNEKVWKERYDTALGSTGQPSASGGEQSVGSGARPAAASASELQAPRRSPLDKAPRLTFNSGIIRNVIQNEKCGYCGMGLCDPREYHPHIACETFLRTHDGREVWRELHRRIRAHDEQLPGLDRLLKGGADYA